MPCFIAIICTVFTIFVIEVQVVILEPVSVAQVIADIRLLEACMVVFDGHVEDTVVSLSETQGILHIVGDIVPFGAIITPGS